MRGQKRCYGGQGKGHWVSGRAVGDKKGQSRRERNRATLIEL